jgi:hypothetical protein
MNSNGHKLRTRTAEELELAHERHEYLRTLNPLQFAALHERNIRGEGRFDDLVDADRTQKEKQSL